MKIRLNTSHRNSLVKRSKCLRREQKQFENQIKAIIANSLVENNNNKELVEKNVSLLAEIESLKREKLDLFQKFMFRQNANQLVIKDDLVLLLESLKSDRKKMVELFQTTNDYFNKMINKIGDKVEEFIENEDKRIESNVCMNESNVNSTEKRVKSREIYEMRQMSRQSRQQNETQTNDLDLSLSVVPEVSQEFSSDANNQRTGLTSVSTQFETPIKKSRNTVTGLELTPQFLSQNLRTPSIFNFECNSFNPLRHGMFVQNDETYYSLDRSERSDFTLSGFETFDTTITEDINKMTSSTPVTKNGTMERMKRPSKRISSIVRPFSPQTDRTSLIDIQNVIQNHKKSRKKSVMSTKSKSKTTEEKEEMESQSNDSNCLNGTKKKRRKCESKSFDSEMSETSVNSNLSSRSLRNRKQVYYKEPSLHGRIRSTD